MNRTNVINSVRIVFLLMSTSLGAVPSLNAQATSCVEPSVSGITYTTVSNGNWNNAAVWVGGVAPGFNIGSNNKVVIRHTIDRNTGDDFFPSSNSVLVIKDGGALTTEQIQMENTSKIIINYGKLHVDHGNFQVKTASASVCAFQACIIVDESFQFEESGINMTFNYTGIQIDNGNLQSTATVTGSDIRLWLKNGNLERNGGSWPSNTITYRRVSGGITGFSGLVANSTAAAIASLITPCNNVPLPVALLRFEVSNIGKSIQLNWITTQEQYNAGFHIQRSNDGIHWDNIGFSKSVANSGKATVDYVFVDNAPVLGNNMYKLKQVGIDGNISYSPIRTVRFGTNNKIKVFPNPAQDQVNISSLQGNEYIKCYDLTGSIIYQTKTNSSSTKIDVSQWANGIYNIKIISDTESSSNLRFVKSK